ncbi:hypothetical protein JYU34_004809, partial [Plutella xylostella]
MMVSVAVLVSLLRPALSRVLEGRGSTPDATVHVNRRPIKTNPFISKEPAPAGPALNQLNPTMCLDHNDRRTSSRG